ncbi:MAG TPA: type II toxin-antitoxin system HigB family toxin [Bacteroidia bacterium]|jgi:mRNA interferase HigB|nr:type II toxin-antitoxin system HigB family toxin [Bacteroidia bacterium]
MDYIADNAQSLIPFEDWLSKLKLADWEISDDIKQTYGTADPLGNGTNRVVFNIGGNNYRMICKYAFGKTQVHLFIKWIGTHAEYDKLCEAGEQYTINLY